MKPSELLMLLMCNGHYNPTPKFGGSRYMCHALIHWAGKQVSMQAVELSNFLQGEIGKRLGDWTTLENHLYNDKGISRRNYEARYEWFLNLAIELEEAGQ